MAAKPRKVKNPFTSEIKTGPEWAEIKGWADATSFYQRLRRYKDNPERAWMSKKEAMEYNHYKRAPKFLNPFTGDYLTVRDHSRKTGIKYGTLDRRIYTFGANDPRTWDKGLLPRGRGAGSSGNEEWRALDDTINGDD